LYTIQEHQSQNYSNLSAQVVCELVEFPMNGGRLWLPNFTIDTLPKPIVSFVLELIEQVGLKDRRWLPESICLCPALKLAVNLIIWRHLRKVGIEIPWYSVVSPSEVKFKWQTFYFVREPKVNGKYKELPNSLFQQCIW